MSEDRAPGMQGLPIDWYEQAFTQAFDWMSGTYAAAYGNPPKENMMEYHKMREIAKEAVIETLVKNGERYEYERLEFEVSTRMPKGHTPEDFDRTFHQAEHYANRAIIVVNIPD